MISPKVLSTAAIMALVSPMAVPSASFAQNPHVKGNYAVRGGTAAAPAARPSVSSGAPTTRFSGNLGGGARSAPVAQSGAAVTQSGTSVTQSGTSVTQYRGGYSGGYTGGHRYYRGGGGFIPGAVAGAVVGGALASSSGYYDSYGYYDGSAGYYAPGYYDDQYYDDGAVAVAPAPAGGDDVTYCMQTYRSYDPASGTYLGYDGLRHPCP